MVEFIESKLVRLRKEVDEMWEERRLINLGMQCKI